MLRNRYGYAFYVVGPLSLTHCFNLRIPQAYLPAMNSHLAFQADKRQNPGVRTPVNHVRARSQPTITTSATIALETRLTPNDATLLKTILPIVVVVPLAAIAALRCGKKYFNEICTAKL